MRAKQVVYFFYCFLLLAFFLVQAGSAQSGDFTIIALPDTQNESQFFPNVLASQTQWIVAHRQELNIQMVLGEGDIVNNFADPEQQESSLAAFEKLDDAGVPYMLAIGNHDYDNADPKAARSVNGFNRFFGPARYAAKAYYRGSFPAGSNENFYGVENIGGQNFLFLVLEFVPRPSSMAWAESILQANQDKQVLVLTHSFTYVDGTRVDRCDTQDMPPGNETGDDMWAVLRKYPNVFMVVSGHLTGGQEARRADLGDQGNLVNQFFTNFQTFPHGGDGWLRIMTFHPASNTVSMQTFSPSLNQFRTGNGDQFTVSYHNPHITRGTGTLSGMVRDFTTCEPIPGVNVSTAGASAVTDTNGRYTMTLTPGAYTVDVNAGGFGSDSKSEVVNDSFDTDLNFFLVKGGPSGSPINLAVAPQSASIKPGDSATFTLKVANNGGLTKPVTFSCSNLPAGDQCNFSPAQLSLSQLPGSAKLTLSTSANSALLRLRNPVRSLALMFFVGASVLLGVFAGAVRSHRKRGSLALLALLMVLAAFGCSGGGASTSGGSSFTVAVTSTSGNAQSSINLSISLQ